MYRGMTAAQLHVDAGNTHHALSSYARHGFDVRSSSVWHKPMELT